MIDVVCSIETTRVNWIKRYLQPEQSEWKQFFNHYTKSCGGVDYLLSCNYSSEKLQMTTTPVYQAIR
jgi:hypothetical protein